MVRDGTARPSESSWPSALHIVPKKDNCWRPCGDYGALNVRTVPDRYPVRHLHDYSHQLSGCRFFSKIDVLRAYNQIPVHHDDIQKTAITTPFGLFEFPFMSFGLRNAAQTFQRSWTMFCGDSTSISRTWMTSSFSPDHSRSTSGIFGLSSAVFKHTGSSLTRQSASSGRPR
jgi:hypothetical protein